MEPRVPKRKGARAGAGADRGRGSTDDRETARIGANRCSVRL
jgi:hypothetical protein